MLALYLLVIAVGMLVGLEIPLLMRILEGRFHFRDLVSHVLTFDYLGALAASIAFPLWLVPKLGLVRAAIMFGMINARWRCGRRFCSATSCRRRRHCAQVASPCWRCSAGAWLRRTGFHPPPTISFTPTT